MLEIWNLSNNHFRIIIVASQFWTRKAAMSVPMWAIWNLSNIQFSIIIIIITAY